MKMYTSKEYKESDINLPAAMALNAVPFPGKKTNLYQSSKEFFMRIICL